MTINIKNTFVRTRFAFVCMLGVSVASTAYSDKRATKNNTGQKNAITALNAKSDGASTTLRLHGSNAATFSVYKLENPSRVVVDIVGMHLSTKLKGNEDKAVWNINSWSVGQVSAHTMSRTRGDLVRVVVGLSRASRYQVRSLGSDIVIEVTAKSAPPSQTTSAVELAAVRKEAARELKEARAEATRIRREAAHRDEQTRAKIAEATAMMESAQEHNAKAKEASQLADAKRLAAVAREESAAAAEKKAKETQRALVAAKEKAAIALQEAQGARARNDKDYSRLEKRAKRATEAAEKRRKAAEIAEALATSRRAAAENASANANAKRMAAADAMRLAQDQAEKARQQQRIAIGERASAEQGRMKAERAAEAAAVRAKELQSLIHSEEVRLAATRTLRKQEEMATAKSLAARKQAEEQQRVAAAAQEKLVVELNRLAQAKSKAATQGQRARTAATLAHKATQKGSAVSRAKQKRLQQEASRLSQSQAKAEAALRIQEEQIAKHRQQVAQLQRKRQNATQSLAVLERDASRAQSRRQKEEKALAELSDKRNTLRAQLDDARKMRLSAQAELQAAQSARSIAETERREAARVHATAVADAQEARQLKAEVERELDVAKRARLTAAQIQLDAVAKIRRAEAREVAAQKQLQLSQNARNQKAVHGDRKAREAAKKLQKSSQRALQQAQKERKLAELARKRGEAALAKASQREAEAARKLALTSSHAAVAAGKKAPKSTTRLREIDVEARRRSTRIVIAMSSPSAPKVISNSGKEAVLLIPLAAIRKQQERTLDASSLGGVVKAVSSYRDPSNPSSLRIVVDLKEQSQGTLTKVGNTYHWDFPTQTPAQIAKQPRRKNRSKAISYRSPSVAGYGSASSPITQQTVAQVRKRKTYSGQKIDLDYKKSDIHDLMRLLADVGGVNIIVPDNINARVTIRLRRVPWDQALDVILASKGLGYKMEGPGLYRIATQKELDAEFEAKLARARLRADSEAPQPEVFNLNYVVANDVQPLLQSLLSPKGSVQTDKRTNAIIVNDVAANRLRVIQMLTRLDTQTPQIQIEARIVEARSTFVREFGIQWGGNMAASAAGGNATGLVFPSSIGLSGAADDGAAPTNGVGASPPNFAVNLPAAIGTGSGGGIGLSLGSIAGNFGLNLRLSALEDEGSVRIISSPKITTSNNIEAKIKSGVSIPISVVSANGVSTTFVPADLQLTVTPSVSLRDCAVSMQVGVKKNEADFVNTGARGDPTLLTKEADTVVLVQDGDTSVIGGIYTRNSGVSFSKVPFFGDLPVIGWFFKNTKENDERTEVLIFITPKITNRDFLPCGKN